MAGRRIALGLRPHTGWAAMVAVDERADGLHIVERRRVPLIDDDLPSQVYHSVHDLPSDEIVKLVERVRASASRAAVAVVDEFTELGLAGVGVVAWQPAVPDSVEQILSSHQLMHAAEGDLYRSVVLDAAESAGVAAFCFPPADLTQTAAAAIGLSESVVTERLASLGMRAGPPWQKDQKEATLAAWAVLRLTASGKARSGSMPGADAAPHQRSH